MQHLAHRALEVTQEAIETQIPHEDTEPVGCVTVANDIVEGPAREDSSGPDCLTPPRAHKTPSTRMRRSYVFDPREGGRYQKDGEVLWVCYHCEYVLD